MNNLVISVARTLNEHNFRRKTLTVKNLFRYKIGQSEQKCERTKYEYKTQIIIM